MTDLEVFVAVADAGSFTAAAAQLGISTSYASRRIKALEAHLGVQLLLRTTRQLRLTESGRAYLHRIRPHLEGLEEAERAVMALHEEARGTLRLTVPLAFGIRHLRDAIAGYLTRHPGVEVEVSFDDRVVDLLGEGYDLAIRGGTLRESSLLARRLLPFGFPLAASPDYLAQRGTPSHPRELADHACLIYTHEPQPGLWPLTGPEGTVEVAVDGRLRANNGDALVTAAEAGHGVLMQPDFLVADSLREGRLVRILEDWHGPRSALWAVYPPSRHLSAKVTLFVDLLAEALQSARW